MRRGALVHSVTGQIIRCVVVDVSKGGAQLEVITPELPEGMLSLLDADGCTTHDLRIVWREGNRIGVCFIASSPLP